MALPLYLSPFQGITTRAFRNLYAQHFEGIDAFFTPYFTVKKEEKLPAKKLLDLKLSFEQNTSLVPQILSNKAEEIISFANTCADIGYTKLNWNLGCPYPQVALQKKGSGLLPYPDEIDALLEQIFKKINIDFSIKCRLGYSSSDEIQQLIPIFNRYPLHELIVHARTGQQKYSGTPNQEAFARLVSETKVPLIYNGDIFTNENYLGFTQSFPPVKGIMLGRGVLYNPFLPASIKGLKLPENPKEIVRSFVEALYLAYRKEQNNQLSLLSALKEYWHYLAFAFDDPTAVYRKIKKVKTFDGYEESVATIFNQHELKPVS